MPFQSRDTKSLEKTDKFILPVDRETVNTSIETNAEDLLSRMERSVNTITKARPHLSSDKSTDGEISNYKTLLEISALVNSSLVTDDILQVVMKRAIELMKAERGFLMLLDDNNQLQFRTVYNLCKEELMQEDFKFLIFALRRVVTNNLVLVFMYSLYLFNPMTSGGSITQVLREGIYPALTILVLAGTIGIVCRYQDSRFRLIAWAVGLGVALSAFWLTREEGMWLLPGLFLLGAFTLISLYRWTGLSFEFFKRSLVCFLPFFILLIFIGSVSLINRIVYGTYAVVEFKTAPFVSAYGALSRVRHPHWRRYVPVPKKCGNQFIRLALPSRSSNHI